MLKQNCIKRKGDNINRIKLERLTHENNNTSIKIYALKWSFEWK